MIKCLICNKATRVLETRDEKRTRICSEGHRRQTIEVDAKLMRLLRRVEATKARNMMRNGQVIGDRAAMRRKAIARHAAAGWSPVASAKDLGLTADYVRKIRKQLKSEDKL